MVELEAVHLKDRLPKQRLAQIIERFKDRLPEVFLQHLKTGQK
jgi:hypothetical protein